jgi:uncharacterized protein YjbI with pentapeptide repeats
MEDERRKRILQLWLWALAGAALVGVFIFVFAVAPSLLIGTPPKGLSAADELKARNDVRTTLVQALAGLAVAGGLVFTYRTYRQNRADQDRTYQLNQEELQNIREEQDRTYQLNQAEQQRASDRELYARAEQDRTYERELYAKAVEQLGHEKAPVRLGALYSLERLAQDKPERRQTIVDVICAYLRMPFSATAPVSKPEPGATVNREEPATETETSTNGNGDTWRQERQVRLTAQRILAEHLRDDRAKDKRFTDPPNPRFWPDIRLDLAGATLIEFSIPNCVMAGAQFNWATFSGYTEFGGATFSGTASFRGATFGGNASFEGATFSDIASFERVTFSRYARFDGATFSGTAWFVDATFSGSALFEGATFSGPAAWFNGATFSGPARFGEATFSGSGSAWFGGATFSGPAEFGRATFGGDARFGGATFSGGAWFVGATFSGTASFGRATFSGDARFGGATFSGDEHSPSFERSHVLSPDAQHDWPAGWCTGPDGRGGYTVVRANDDGRS